MMRKKHENLENNEGNCFKWLEKKTKRLWKPWKSLKIGVKYAGKLTKVAWKMSENLKIQFYVTFLDLYP